MSGFTGHRVIATAQFCGGSEKAAAGQTWMHSQGDKTSFAETGGGPDCCAGVQAPTCLGKGDMESPETERCQDGNNVAAHTVG